MADMKLKIAPWTEIERLDVEAPPILAARVGSELIELNKSFSPVGPQFSTVHVIRIMEQLAPMLQPNGTHVKKHLAYIACHFGNPYGSQWANPGVLGIASLKEQIALAALALSPIVAAREVTSTVGGVSARQIGRSPSPHRVTFPRRKGRPVLGNPRTATTPASTPATPAASSGAALIEALRADGVIGIWKDRARKAGGTDQLARELRRQAESRGEAQE